MRPYIYWAPSGRFGIAWWLGLAVWYWTEQATGRRRYSASLRRPRR